MTATLEIQDLSLAYATDTGLSHVVKDASLALHRGQITGVAGESGCGKSTLALAALGYSRPGVKIIGGEVAFQGENLLALPRSAKRRLWGAALAYVPQGLSNALNPVQTVGRQLSVPMRHHMDLPAGVLEQKVTDLIASVGIPNASSARSKYPHQFSGGQQQRLGLALALSCDPKVLILDEPTTGVDVSSQVEIIRLLRHLVTDREMSALFVSHDLTLLSGLTDTLAIMYAGEVVEMGPTPQVIAHPGHAYTRALLDAAPTPESPLPVGIPGMPPPRVVVDECSFAPRCSLASAECWAAEPRPVPVGPGHLAKCVHTREVREFVRPAPAAPSRAPGHEDVLLRVDSLTCDFRQGDHTTRAVNDISAELGRGRTLGIIGESGSGKSTLIRAIAGLHKATTGTVVLGSEALNPSVVKRTLEQRRAVQMVFQDPDTTLNPRHTIGYAISRPLHVYRPELSARDRRREVQDLLRSVLLPAEHASRYPQELSGGQRQRVALARAFAAQPRLLLCDEVTAALDVSVQASMLELIANLTAETGTSVIFVSHDLEVVRGLADTVMVLKDGDACEYGPAHRIFNHPSHPYSRKLLDDAARTHCVAM